MEYKNFFRWLEIVNCIEINKELRKTLTEHFGANLNIYTDEDLYEQNRKFIQNRKYANKYKKYWFEY